MAFLICDEVTSGDKLADDAAPLGAVDIAADPERKLTDVPGIGKGIAGIICDLLERGTFSKRDTHFRISYAASDETLNRGIEILNKLARRK